MGFGERLFSRNAKFDIIIITSIGILLLRLKVPLKNNSYIFYTFGKYLSIDLSGNTKIYISFLINNINYRYHF